MTYKEVWEEQKEFLNKSLKYLEERMDVTNSDEEYERLRSKHEGMNIAYDRMVQTENMYEMK